MFVSDRSASRGQMAARKLYVFKHKDALGNAPAHRLFDRIQIGRSTGEVAPRRFDEYKANIEIDQSHMPERVELIEMF